MLLSLRKSSSSKKNNQRSKIRSSLIYSRNQEQIAYYWNIDGETLRHTVITSHKSCVCASLLMLKKVQWRQRWIHNIFGAPRWRKTSHHSNRINARQRLHSVSVILWIFRNLSISSYFLLKPLLILQKVLNTSRSSSFRLLLDPVLLILEEIDLKLELK